MPRTEWELEPLEHRSLLVLAVPFVNGPQFIETTHSALAIAAPAAEWWRPLGRSGGVWGGGPDTASADGLISLDDFRADPRFAGIDGSGSTVVVVDTGIDLNHPAFGPDADGDGVADRIVFHYDFADDDADAGDTNGHGSNVSSIIGSSSAVYPGVAPGVSLIHLKVFTNAGAGAFGMVEEALQWVVEHAAEYHVVAVNMSLGDTLNHNAAGGLYGVGDEIRALAEQGVIVVSAAGNSFYTFASAPGVAYPASDPYSLAVGAVFDSSLGQVTYGSGAVAYSTGPDRVAPFSQRSALLDVLAPGAAILGAGASGNTVSYHGTSQAAPHVAGVVALVQKLALRELGRFLSFGEFRSLLASSADPVVDGDDENDNVTNTGAAFPRLDVMALAEAVLAIAPPDAPEIGVRDGDEVLIDSLGRVSFAATAQGQPVDRTLTVTNLGLQPLALDPVLVLPVGFEIAPGGGLSATALVFGESATVTIRLTASTVGDYSGTLSIASNDSDEHTFDVPLTARVSGPATIIDDGAPGSARTGTWTTLAAGFLGDVRTSPSGSGSNTATWSFSNVPAGRYRVCVTYTTGSTRATNAAYEVWEGTIRLGTAAVNQRVSPSDRTDAGANWEDLGVFPLNAGLSLAVRLSNKANGVVAADAVRIERLGGLPEAPEIMVFAGTAGGTELLDGAGSVGYGSTPVQTGVTKTFTIANVGGWDLTLNPSITLPPGYALAGAPGVTTLAPGTTTAFSVRLAASAIGPAAGVMSIASNDPDEGSFDTQLSGTVTAIFRDDGAPGFAAAGTWSILTGGYLNDYRAAAAGGGSNAVTWTISGLLPGTYRVSITYVPGSTRATNAPFSVRNGATTVGTFAVNQRIAPASRFDANRWWRDLGTFTISSTLVVRLTNAANGSVLADGVRIEPV